MKLIGILCVLISGLIVFQNCSSYRGAEGNEIPSGGTEGPAPNTIDNSEDLQGDEQALQLDANIASQIEIDPIFDPASHKIGLIKDVINGEIVVGTSTFEYTPERAFLGLDAFKYGVYDNNSNALLKEVSVLLNINPTGDKIFEAGVWIADRTCTVGGGGTSTVWMFDRGRFRWTTNLYDPECVAIIATHRGEGLYSLGSSMTNSEGQVTREIDMTGVEHVLIPRTAAGVASLNGMGACGFSDWSLAVLKRVSGRDCASLNIQAGPNSYQSLSYRIMDDRRILYGSLLEGVLDGSTPAKRSTQLWQDLPMEMRAFTEFWFVVGDYNLNGVSYSSDGYSSFCTYPNFRPEVGYANSTELIFTRTRLRNDGLCVAE